MREQRWTVKMVEMRLEEAADTLRRLPSVIPPSRLCSWPDIIRDYWELHGGADPAQRFTPASPKAIREMDEALEWLRFLDVKDGRIVWLRACHVRWNVIGAKFHLGRRAAWRRWVAGLQMIVVKLNQ